MSDQNQFDHYREKFLQYWRVFLSFCGTLWEKAKVYLLKAGEFLRHYGKILARHLAVLALKTKEYLQKAFTFLSFHGKRLLQKLAVFALKVREELKPLCQRLGAWFAAQKARFVKKQSQDPAQPQDQSAATRILPWLGKALDEEEDFEIEAEEETAAEPATGWARAFEIMKLVFSWIWKLRAFIMASPVVWAAVKLARENMERLPEKVGLDIQSTGEFAQMVTRNEAVYWPLGITLFCLLLTVCSKKPLLPWVISIFTLVLPWLIWLTNYYA